MALANFDAYKAKIASPDEVIDFMSNHVIRTGTGWTSHFANTGKSWNNEVSTAASSKPGTTPSLCDRTTVGAMGQKNAPAGLTSHVWVSNLTTNTEQMFMVADRLAHVSGLSAAITTVQNINFPTLTRYADGSRVIAAVEIYTSIGATPTTFTMNYTNQDGVAKTSPPNAIGSSADLLFRLSTISLAQGDTGVRNVASIQLAATTNAAGDFGITLFRPLLCIPLNPSSDYLNSGEPLREISLHLPRVLDNACLQFMSYGAGSITTVMTGDVNFMWV